MKKHVDVLFEDYEFLYELKADMGLKTLAAALHQVVLHYKSEAAPLSSESPAGSEAEEPQKRRRIDVREALLSLEIVDARPGMLEYYMGFDRLQVETLIRRFSEVKRARLFFAFSSCQLWVTPVVIILSFLTSS